MKGAADGSGRQWDACDGQEVQAPSCAFVHAAAGTGALSGPPRPCRQLHREDLVVLELAEAALQGAAFSLDGAEDLVDERWRSRETSLAQLKHT